MIGVASEGFHGTGIRALDVWVPMGMVAAVAAQGTATLTDRGVGRLLIGARLKPGVSIVSTAAEMDVIGKTLEREDAGTESPDRGYGCWRPRRFREIVGPIVAFLALIMAIVSMVLIIACANVAGVLLRARRLGDRRWRCASRLARDARDSSDSCSQKRCCCLCSAERPVSCWPVG